MKSKRYPENVLYTVLENGDIIGPKGGKLKYAVNNCGYPFVAISGVCRTVHRIVAKTFIPNPLNKKCVNHKDGDKLNNRVSNLEWVTHSENAKHAFKNGLKIHKGENGPSHKLSELSARVIKEAALAGYPMKDIAAYFNISYSTVSNIKQGHKWAHLL